MCLAVVPASPQAGPAPSSSSPRLSAEQRSAVLSLLQTLDGGGGSSGTTGSGASSRQEKSRQKKNRKKVCHRHWSNPLPHQSTREAHSLPPTEEVS